ncbi:hypothetical protein JHK87_046183 [Glycine soja]|nr:hypothetical protein JHK87_046183 [Glycine soja]
MKPSSNSTSTPIPHSRPLLQNRRCRLQSRSAAAADLAAGHGGCSAHQPSRKAANERGVRREVSVGATHIRNLHPPNNIIVFLSDDVKLQI